MQLAAIVVSLAVTVVALALVGRTAAYMVRVLRTGQPALGERSEGLPGRIATMLRETLGHTRMLRWSVQGAAHWFVFIGFGALVFTLIEAYGELFSAGWHLPGLGGAEAYGFAIELIAALTGLGILVLIAIRLLDLPSHPTRKSRFAGSNAWMAYYVEYTIVGIVVCIFALRGLHVALGEFPYGEINGISYAVGEVFDGMDPDTLVDLVFVFAMLKVAISMAWFIVLALNANMGIAWHRFTAWPNIVFKRAGNGRVALGPLPPILSGGKPVDFEDPDEDDLFGAGAIEQFTWKGLLDVSTCTECGRCQSQCPAWHTGKPLSPKLLIMSMRDHLYAKAPYLLAGGGTDMTGEERASAEQLADVPAAALAEAERPLVGGAEELGVIDPDVLWSCTTCGACVEQCPVDIEHVDHIVDMRRYQVLIESAFPSEAGVMLKNIENKGNPWGMNASARLDWIQDLPFEVRVVEDRIPDDVEYLYWVGCAGALEDRSKKTTRAFAELLHTADVGFAILGPAESCNGDPARRLGNEFLFQMQAQSNVETLTVAFGDRPRDKRKIIATCPHCFNTLANEYPQVGGEFEVVHHTQLLDRLVSEGRLVPVTPIDEKVTYHDPCYLGRHNRVYTPPREVLGAVPGLRSEEMHRCKERGFCCGAGGARMWMEEKIGKQVNVERVDEALSLDPDVVGTACPFCMVMLSDAVTAKKQSGEAGEQVQVLDVAQILARSVRAPEPAREPILAGAASRAAAQEPSPEGSNDVTSEFGDGPIEPSAEQTAAADQPQLAEAAVDDSSDPAGAQESRRQAEQASEGETPESIEGDDRP